VDSGAVVSRLPEIKILANTETEFSEARVGKRLVAVRWRVAETWFVATPNAGPQQHDTGASAYDAFLKAAMAAAGGAS